jgi:hypothetical protein
MLGGAHAIFKTLRMERLFRDGAPGSLHPPPQIGTRIRPILQSWYCGTGLGLQQHWRREPTWPNSPCRNQHSGTRMLDVPVLIVGGGPVGLTASILLSQQGVRSLLVERHPGTAILPKARGINARTMEMYRQIGIEQAIRDAGLPTERTGLIVWTESLAGREIERRVPGRMAPSNRGASPVLNCLCAQDDLEPVLRRFAEAQAPAELCFDTEMTAVRQDAGGVAAVLSDRIGGNERQVRAQYLIAADGAQSRVRRMVASRMIGAEGVYDSVNTCSTPICGRGPPIVRPRSTSSSSPICARRSSRSTPMTAGAF